MSLILKLRMISDECDNFIRDYEMPDNSTLLDFHNFICDDLAYDATNMSSFFVSNGHWEKVREYTLVDMGVEESEASPRAMENYTLGQILKHKGDRLIYVFDAFEDRAMFLELMGAEKMKDGLEYPRTAFANGEAPDQFDANLPVSNKSIFEEAMDDYAEFDGDDEYDDSL